MKSFKDTLISDLVMVLDDLDRLVPSNHIKKAKFDIESVIVKIEEGLHED